MRFLFTALILIFITGCDAPTPAPQNNEKPVSGLIVPAGFETATQTILAANLLADVSKIAGDEFEGRGAGSEGDRKARAHLAGRLAEIGYEPLFDNGSYEQEVEIVGLTVQEPADLQFTSKEGSSVGYRFGDEYMIMAGAQQPEISVQDA